MPVLLRAFPQGLDLRDATRSAALRENYEDWLERGRPLLHVHTAWIRHVLQNLLEWPADFIASPHASSRVPLAAALGRVGSAASSLRSSTAPPTRPSAQEQFELAGEIKFSYQMSISQPTEILTI